MERGRTMTCIFFDYGSRSGKSSGTVKTGTRFEEGEGGGLSKSGVSRRRRVIYHVI